MQPSRPPKTSLGWEDGCDEEAFPQRPTSDVRIADIHARADSRSTNCGNCRTSNSEILQANGSAKDTPSSSRHSKTFDGIHAGLSGMSVLAFAISTKTINLHQVDKHIRSFGSELKNTGARPEAGLQNLGSAAFICGAFRRWQVRLSQKLLCFCGPPRYIVFLGQLTFA